MLNIAMLTNNYKPFIGGVPISIERLAKGLRAIGHQVTIFAPDSKNSEEETDVVRYKVLYRKDIFGMALGNCFDKRIENRFRESSFDVIHVHHPVIMGQTALYLSKKYNIPVVYTYHTRYEEYLHYFKLYKAMAVRQYPIGQLAKYGKEVLLPVCITAFTNKCNLVIAPSNSMKNYLIKQGTKTKIEVLPTGIDDSAFKSNPLRIKQIRSQYLGECKYLFVTVSRLEKEKNIEFLLRSIAQLKCIINNCFKILIIGDGTEKANLQGLSKMLNIEEQVIFIGKILNTEVRHYLNASDVFLFSSKSETQGIVIIEAMAAGCPVVAISANGVIDVVKHGKNGYISDEDPTNFAIFTTRIINDRHTYSQLSKLAYETASAYRITNVAKRAVELYGHLQKER